jgi:hypothetical protein
MMSLLRISAAVLLVGCPKVDDDVVIDDDDVADDDATAGDDDSTGDDDDSTGDDDDSTGDDDDSTGDDDDSTGDDDDSAAGDDDSTGDDDDTTGDDDSSTGDDDTPPGNLPPSAPTLHLEPASPATADDLVLVIDTPSVDPDGDPVTLEISWTIGASPQPALSGLSTISASLTTRGEAWTVSVLATDGSLDAAPVLDTVTIQNTPPSMGSLSITPGVAATTASFSALPGGFLDADGDAAAWVYEWQADSVVLPLEFAASLDASGLVPGAEVTVTTWPDDGVDLGSPMQATARVNTPPTLLGGSLTVQNARPDGFPNELSTLLAAGTGAADADLDPVTVEYDWTVAGLPLAATTATLDGSSFSRGDLVAVTVTPHDGIEAGGTLGPYTILVGNTPPTAPVVALEPTAPTEEDDLHCVVVSAATDLDLDLPTLSWSWYRDGVPEGAWLSSTVPASATEPGDGWECRAVASDGLESSAVATASVGVCAGQEFWPDGDLDGWGDDVQPSGFTCTPPPGTAVEPGDCDDGNALVHPLGGDVAGDAVDDDCDGEDCAADWIGPGASAPYAAICPMAVEGVAARLTCSAMGHEGLLSVRNQGEQDGLVALLTRDGLNGSLCPWIGLTDELVEGSFGWLDGSSDTFRAWGGGQPDNSFGADCVVANFPLGPGLWDDWGCSSVPPCGAVACQSGR